MCLFPECSSFQQPQPEKSYQQLSTSRDQGSGASKVSPSAGGKILQDLLPAGGAPRIFGGE